ncbi:PAS domain-containing sensor histidine kinase [Paraburkholderia fungorum]|uniref:PAS domain-containing sensor histidine kinase n=1 Tax=Paraburkholderia fungorum TaxID=134537 RepID=UPI0038BD8491
MSIVLPAIVILQAAIILWLLVHVWRQGTLAIFTSLKTPDIDSSYPECVMAKGCAINPALLVMADKAEPQDPSIHIRQSAASRGEHSHAAAEMFRTPPDPGRSLSRAKRPFTEKLRTMASARQTRRKTYDAAARAPLSQDAHVGAIEQVSGEHYFREALASLPLPILMVDERGLMAMVNPQADRLFGYERDELIGKPVELLVHALRSDSKTSLWADPFAIRPTRGLLPLDDLSACRKDGTEFRVEIGLNAFHFDGQNVTLAFVIDITDRYELRRQRQDLAHLTRVSTMGQLASSLAHELNQPLTAILSNVQAAQRFMTADPIDLAELRDILNDIVQDDYRASEVIRRIRAVVKKGDIEVTPLDLASVMRDVVALVRSDAIVRGTRVTLDIDDTLPLVCGDRVQLQQVMLNLLLNAFDAMNEVPPADRVVFVTLKPADSGMVVVAVCDRGHGLTADKLDKIFKPFFTSKPQGLGLGLSISRSIIDMHRGRLWAENNNDRGATFYVALPAGNAVEEDKSRYRP